MLKIIEKEMEILGAYSRSRVAADLTEKARDARSAEKWQKAYTFLEGALTLQPRREDAGRMLGALKKSAPSGEKFHPSEPDVEAVGEIKRLISAEKKANPARSGAKDLKFKGTTLRQRAWEEKYPLSLVFGAVFITWMAAGLGFHGFKALTLPDWDWKEALAYVPLGLLSLAGGYMLIKRTIAGLIISSVATIVVFVGFWAFFVGLEPGHLRIAFLSGCLPAFLMIIVLLMNIKGILARHKREKQIKAVKNGG